MKTWLVRPLTIACLMAFLCAFSTAADPKKAPEKKDPPGVDAITTPMKAWFKKAAGKDGTMDKNDAARAFGFTRTYDAGPEITSPGTKPTTTSKEESENTETPSTAKQPTKGGDDKPDKKYANRPDYMFMFTVDKDKDGKVTEEEFDAWAHDYAVKYLQMVEAEKKAAEAELKKEQAAMRKHQQEAQRLRSGIHNFAGQIHRNGR